MKLLFFFFLAIASWTQQLAYAQIQTQVVDLPTRLDVKLRVLVLTPANPKAAVILFAGGHGGLQIYPNGSMKWGDNNFLVRTREMFAAQGLAVAVVDAPSDRMRAPFLYGFRQSDEHAQDIKELIAWLRLKAEIPIWLIGTSRGTESAASVGLKLQGLAGLRGLVLTSSILVGPQGQAVSQMPLSDFQGPVLVVHHELDACRVTLFSDLPKLKAQLKPNAVHEVMTFQGGISQGDSCQAMSYHGFNGIESEVVNQITNWVIGR